jgi:trk system potassium uptake protein TrkA
MNIIVAGYSTFTWALATALEGKTQGRLYFVVADADRAMEASLQGDLIAVKGDITDIEILDQLNLAQCHTFVAGSREDEANVLSALYAKNNGARYVYARVFEIKLVPLLESLGIVPIQTSHMAAASLMLRILKPAVSELVSLTQGQFALEEIQAGEFPELVGCRLGNLQGEHLHIIAVAKGGNTRLSYNTLVEPDSKLIIIYDKGIERRLVPELHRVAAQAARRLEESSRS